MRYSIWTPSWFQICSFIFFLSVTKSMGCDNFNSFIDNFITRGIDWQKSFLVIAIVGFNASSSS